ncbi:cleavage and polyadenylation specific factor 5 [Aspergillus ochraceoroseus]|uniref:Cleavage and polyadenylation specificity factor subunit 5 n=1 Tax=Aspergillus ochraceoroseus TaxID=138278 RepID=A0A0F8V712_9EURO|nr:cleavage and polyadenylation specific factor 5 [Aspergillus ochraceoroseus]
MSTTTATSLQSSYPPIIPKDFSAKQPKTIRLYPLSNYTFGTKETQPEEDPSVLARLKRLEEHYDEHGMRRTCEGILVCHEHNHPHVLMLQIANAFFKLYVRPLAFGSLTVGNVENLSHMLDVAGREETDRFKKRLNERLAPVGSQFSGEGVNEDWEIGDTLAQWWRPNFETFMYPFLPGHVTRPKECKKLYFIQLPKKKVLSVPKNMKLLAVPLFELYDNTARYGPQLSAIPHLLSRYNFEFVDENDNVVAATPGAPLPDGQMPRTKILAGSGAEEQDQGMADYGAEGTENGGEGAQ